MSLEFDGRCGTAQSDDSLQLYIRSSAALSSSHPDASPAAASPADAASSAVGRDGIGPEAAVSSWCPVLRKFHGVDGWPSSAVILPGEYRVRQNKVAPQKFFAVFSATVWNFNLKFYRFIF